MSNYQDGDFQTKYGVITVRNPGRVQAPPNLQTLKRRQKDGYTKDAGDVVLQGPAVRAFKAAEVRATRARLRRRGKVEPIILTGVGYRSYASQAVLYHGPTNTNGTRFANPDGSLHVEALAIDNHMGFFRLIRRTRVKRALLAEGWFFAVPGEIWHASFGLKG